MFFQVLDPVQAHALHSVVMCFCCCCCLFVCLFVFDSFDLEQFLRLPFYFLTLIFLQTGQLFCGMSLRWAPLIFSQGEAQASRFWREIPWQFSHVPLSTSYQGEHNTDLSCRWSHMLWCWCLLAVFIIRFLFSICDESVTYGDMIRLHVSSWAPAMCPTCWRGVGWSVTVVCKAGITPCLAGLAQRGN